MDQYEYTFVVPEDVAYDVGGRRVDCPVDNIPGDVKSASPCLDIGGETDLKYSDIIRHAQVIYMKGPLGKYEDRPFASGSSRVLSTFAGSRGYSVIGGGDTTSMFDHFSLDHDKIRHISLAGGALVRALAGEELPGVEVLKASYRNAEHRTAMGLK